MPRFASVHDACRASVQAEIDNAAIYDRILQSTHRDDILRVYRALQSASTDRHLPAFQRCAMRGGTPLHELWLRDPGGYLLEVYARLTPEELTQMPADMEPVFLPPGMAA